MKKDFSKEAERALILPEGVEFPEETAKKVSRDVYIDTKHAEEVRYVPVELIDEDPNQPRDQIDEESEDFKGLVASIAKNGLLQALVVEFKQESKRFLLVAGERRLRSVRKLGWKEVKCEIKQNLSPVQRLAYQMVENVQRLQFKPVEYARGMFALKEHLGKEKPWRVVEELLGISEDRRKQLSVLLKLPDHIQKLIVAPGAGKSVPNGMLTEEHGRALYLLQKNNHLDKMRELAKKIREGEEGITGNVALKIAREMLGKKITKTYSIQITRDWSIKIDHSSKKELVVKLERAIEKIKAELKLVRDLAAKG